MWLLLDASAAVTRLRNALNIPAQCAQSGAEQRLILQKRTASQSVTSSTDIYNETQLLLMTLRSHMVKN